jgi:hypothetical protein
MARQAANEFAERTAHHRRRLRAGADLKTRLEQAEVAAKAAALRSPLTNTLYRGTEAPAEESR